MTIEERARIANKKWLLSDEVSNNGYEQGYIKGATEQQKISTEKSKAFVKQLMEELIANEWKDLQPEPYHTNAIDYMIGRLTKAMEE